MKLLRVAGGEVLEEETSYKGRLSVGEDMALAISKVTPQDTRTFVCRVEAGSQGVGENRSELRVYSECRAARGRGASRPPSLLTPRGGGFFQRSLRPLRSRPARPASPRTAPAP